MVSGFGAGILGGATVAIVIKAIDQFSGVFRDVNKGMLVAGAAITAMGIVGAKAIGGLIKAAGNFEQTKIAFTTMLGSAEKATILLKELADFATRTPFTITGVEQNAKQLLAMGISTKDLLPTLKSLGDISAGLNVPLERLALNFGQVKVQGKLTGRELRDFSVAGVPLIAELAKNLNIAESEVKDMVSAGDIGFAEVEDAFISMTSEGGKFFDLMDAQSKTFLGQVSNIKDSFEKVSRTMGEVFLPAAKWVAEHLAVLVAWFEEHPKLAKFAVVLLAVTTALALIAGPIIILLALLPAVIAGFGLLTAVTLPITLTILAIAAAIGVVIAAFIWWKEISLFLRKVVVRVAIEMQMAWEVFRDFWKVTWEGITNLFKWKWNEMVEVAAIAVDRIIGLLEPLVWVYNKIVGLWGGGKIDLGGIREQVGAAIRSAKSELTDLEAMSSRLEKAREESRAELEMGGDMLIKQLEERLGLEEKITEQVKETNTEQDKLTAEQQQTVKNLEGFKVLYKRDPTTGIKTYGDIFNPGAFQQSEFKSKSEYEQAKLGGGVYITIENVIGLDPEEISRALSDELNNQGSN